MDYRNFIFILEMFPPLDFQYLKQIKVIIMKKNDLDRIIIDLSMDKESALEELFLYFYPRLFYFSKKFLKIEEGIDDILQEVFVKIWHNRKNIKSTETFNSFIFTITRNHLINELRRRLNNQKIRDEIQKLSIAEEYDVLEQLQFKYLKEEIDKVVDKLPVRQKEIFLLSRQEGLSYKEIAIQLNITTKTVEYHINRATTFVKEKLNSLGLMSQLCFYLFY